MPNINNLLLQLQLPHRGNGSNGSARKHHEDDTHHHSHHDETEHHSNHIFTWSYLKRKPSSSSLVSGGSEDDIATEPPTSQKSMSLTLSTSHHRRSVSFGTCEVRTYSQVLGDHPCCLEGCPVQLGWKYQTQELLEVDEYESHHQDTVLHELRLTPDERRKILIFSKQQQYVKSFINKYNADSSASCKISVSDGDNRVFGARQESRDSTGSDPDSADTTTTTHTNNNELPPAISDMQHERELRRECRRLNRCGSWNVNIKASRKRNKRTQQAFFGTTTTGPTIPAPPSDVLAGSGPE